VRHHPDVRVCRTLLAASALLAACADPSEPESGAPDVAEIVCESDGSTTVLTPTVRVQRDGLHVHVVSRLDEPAELVGLGRDVEPGETMYVSTAPPGRTETACYPYSRHDQQVDPDTTAIEILDPEGMYVGGEIDCLGPASGSISDFSEAPMDVGPVPLEEARAAIDGLRPEDDVVHTGYPGRNDRGVAVLRDEDVVASFTFVTFDGEEWSIESSTICESSGLRQI
jgi:hypothetical protein